MSRSVVVGFVCAAFSLSLAACAPEGAGAYDGRSAERAIENIEPGMLVISEVMIDPVDCPDLQGEWFEVTNLTDSWLQLEGLTVTDSDFYRSTLSKFELAPGGRAVVVQGPKASSCTVGIDAAATFEGDIALNNRGDALHIYNHKTGILIDQTPIFPAEYVVPGSSIQLQPESHDPRANDSLNAWYVGADCPYDAQEPSPGEANRFCDLDAPAPEVGWFGLTCQGYDCEVPPNFDATLHLAEAWDEASERADWAENGGDTVYFSNISMQSRQPVRAGDWFTTGEHIDVHYEFAVPGDWDNDIWDYWVWLDLAYNEGIVDTDSSFGSEELLNRDASLGMLGGIGIPQAIEQLASSDPDFQIYWIRVQKNQGDAEARLVIREADTDRKAIWNVTTGARIQ